MYRIILTLLPMFFSYKDALTFVPVIIQGTVLHAQTQTPLAGVYVYITKGEEEALTDKLGAFSIKTWRTLPLTITIQQADTIVTQQIVSAQKPLRIFVRSAKGVN